MNQYSDIELAPQRAAQGRFVKGQSGNPSGRPVSGKGLADYVREKSLQGKTLIDFLFRIVSGEERMGSRERLVATSTLLDRGFGKSVDIVAQVAVDASPETEAMRELASEALSRIACALHAKKAPSGGGEP